MSATSNGHQPFGKDAEPVDVTVGNVKPLPENLQRTLNAFQRFMRSPVGAIVFALIAFTIGSPPVIGVPPVLYLLQLLGVFPHWPIRRFFDQCTANWMSVMTMVYEKMYGIKIRTFGHSGRFKRRSLIIMNHVSHMDWMYLWSVIDRQGDLSFWKVVTKKLPVRSLPILGQCMQMSCFVFIERNWEKDKEEFRDKLYYYNAINYPLQLLLFPEGGDFTPKMKKRSDKFAQENDLPTLDYCFHPRTTGFKYAVNALRDGVGGLDAVYDLTIAYPDVLPKTELDVGRGVLPREVHFHVKKHDDKDVPENQEELEKWLRDRWLEKEERLKTFYKYKEFREDATAAECVNGNGFGGQNGLRHSAVNNGHSRTNGFTSNSTSNGISSHFSRSPEVLRPRNMYYFMYSIFIFISTNLLMFLPMYYFPYFNLYMILGALFLCFGHYWKGMGHLFMLFKRKEIEREIRNSKYNK